MLVYNFPGYNCISLNDEAVHGIPGPRKLHPGDVVKLDVTIELDGYMADAAETVIVPPAPPIAEELAACAGRAFARGMQQARAGAHIWEIGRAVEQEVKRNGFAVIRELSGHGIGRKIHEPPTVPNYRDTSVRGKLTDGLVLTIEPIIASGSGACFERNDGWTVATSDGSLSAHYEHTLVITKGGPIVLTA